MESRGTVPAGAIGADETPELAALLDRDGPFVSVFLSTEPDVEQASQQSIARWRNVRRDLEEQGAPGSALDAIEALVPDAHQSGRVLAVIADDSGVLVRDSGLDGIAADVARLGSVPSYGPFVEWRQSSPNHAVVLVDRVGADISLFLSDDVGGDALLSVGDTRTDDPHLRKSKPGGWSQRRFQQRAENSWDANMKAVAERLAKLSQIVDLRLVVIAGDVRGVAMLKEHLPPQVGDRICEIEGQRSVDGDIDDLTDDVMKVVSSAVASDTVAFLEKFREERGQADRAADGVDATLQALSEARVDTLLVHDDPGDGREAWFSVAPPLAASDPARLSAQGVEEPRKGRLVDVLIGIALRTGARVRIVPSTAATDGVGAILRY